MTDKIILRRQLLAARAAIAGTMRSDWDAQIAKAVQAWLAPCPPATLGVYWAMRGEPDLLSLYGQLTDSGIQLALPVVSAPDAPLRFLCWAPGEAVRRDTMGLWIPEHGREVVPETLLIPCLGFNAQRQRLGYGGGFYDRTLAHAPQTATAGIAYACAAARFTGEPHDVLLDVIITEVS